MNWNLVPEENRKKLVSAIKQSLFRYGDLLTDDMLETAKVAAQVLEETAPYPDEALFFDIGRGEHWEFCGLSRGRGTIRICRDYGTTEVYLHCLTPLTPAAAKLLNEIINKKL